MEAALQELEDALGHAFAAPSLLVCALTHRSLAREQAAEQAAHDHRREGLSDEATVDLLAEAQSQLPCDNERLEFLGDAVLGLVVAESLFAEHPDWHEGELTRVRAQLVSRQHLARVAEALGLGRHLRLSKGEDKSGLRRKSTVISNTMEAVIGALFLDGGLEPVRRFAREYVLGEAAEILVRELQSGASLGNYKSALQEFLQSAQVGTPVYHVKSESGPDHRKKFLIEVLMKRQDGSLGQALALGTGSTKKRGEQEAARRALEGLQAGAIKIEGWPSDDEETAGE